MPFVTYASSHGSFLHGDQIADVHVLFKSGDATSAERSREKSWVVRLLEPRTNGAFPPDFWIAPGVLSVRKRSAALELS